MGYQHVIPRVEGANQRFKRKVTKEDELPRDPQSTVEAGLWVQSVKSGSEL